MRIRYFTLSAITALLLALPLVKSTSDDNSAKLAKIRQLMELTGTRKLQMQAIDKLFEAYKETQPSVPDAAWDSLKAQFNTDEMIDLLVPVYDKYLSAEDVDGLVAFYSSDVGKRFVEVLPQIQLESIQAGMQYGREISVRLMYRLQNR